MSIYTYLHEDHQGVKDIMNEIEALGDGSDEERVPLFNELKENLIIHTKAEEKVFYQALDKLPQLGNKIQHARKEHEEAEQLLEELSNEDLNGPAWRDKFRALKESVEHHISEEEGDVFELAKATLDKETAEAMEQQMVREKNELERHADFELLEFE